MELIRSRFDFSYARFLTGVFWKLGHASDPISGLKRITLRKADVQFVSYGILSLHFSSVKHFRVYLAEFRKIVDDTVNIYGVGVVLIFSLLAIWITK